MALRRGHSPAGQRDSLQAAPAGRPDASARPSAALARFSRLKCSRDYLPRSIHPHRGRAGGRRVRACGVRGRALCRPALRGLRFPAAATLPPGRRGFVGSKGGRLPLPAPHLHRAGSRWTTDYFLRRRHLGV